MIEILVPLFEMKDSKTVTLAHAQPITGANTIRSASLHGCGGIAEFDGRSNPAAQWATLPLRCQSGAFVVEAADAFEEVVVVS